MKIYRKFRTSYRFIFRSIIDRRGKRQYLKLITQRFPSISQWSDKGYVLDLGANKGNFSAAALSLGFKVISVEPHPTAFRYLQKRFNGNRNVTLIDKAVSQNQSTVSFQVHPNHKYDPLVTSLSASIIPEKFKITHDAIEVESVTFSQLLSTVDKLSILKVDIEGAEMYLFQDIVSQHEKTENLLLETHSRFMLSYSNRDRYTLGLGELKKFI
jgi:FkbM family methyltransferase